MPRIARVGLLVAVLGGTMAAAVAGSEPTVVEEVDLERYMGQWYAIAHIPTTFERRCVTGTAAHYRLLDDGRIEVTNTCCKADGELQRAQGRAWIPDPGQPGKLKVSFVRFLWWWLFPGDYWILALGPDYSYAVVGHPERTFGWILSRTPTVSPELLSEIVCLVEAQGYAWSDFALISPADCLE